MNKTCPFIYMEEEENSECTKEACQFFDKTAQTCTFLAKFPDIIYDFEEPEAILPTGIVR